jgi:hypothetical protein
MLYWMFCVSYSLIPITSFSDIEGVLVSYQNGPIAQEVCWINFWCYCCQRKLPVTVTENFIANSGLSTEKLNVLGFTAAENVGMNPSV